MIQVRFNTNFGVLPNQKRWRVLIDGGQIFTNNVDIRTKSWTTKDIVKGDDGEDVEKWHVTCKPDVVSTNLEDGVKLWDYNYNAKKYVEGPEEEPEQPELVTIKWSLKANKWKVNIKGEDRLYDEIYFKTNVWTSDVSPELCCRPKHIGLVEVTDTFKKLHLSD